MKLASILLTIFLAGCATTQNADTPMQTPAKVQIQTQPMASTAAPAPTAAQATAVTVLKDGVSHEVFECKVKWKDGKKNRETEAFKVRVDYTKNTVESGSFSAKAPNVKTDNKVIRFTAYNKHVSQVAVLTRSTGAFQAQFINSKNKAKIDGQGNCKKIALTQESPASGK